MSPDAGAVEQFLGQFESPFGSETDGSLEVVGGGALPSAFAVTDLATASIGAAGRAVAGIVSRITGQQPPAVTVDRRLASSWFVWTLNPIGWEPTAAWDDLAGIYRSTGGWIRLHTNAPHHRRAALRVLGLAAADTPSKSDVEQQVAMWSDDELEQAIVDEHGCAARLRSEQQWADHPQGQAVAAEPVAHVEWSNPSRIERRSTATPEHPLQGVRVLDLTRVLAGPIATRFLAGLGADVLRLDPPGWDEPGIVPEVTRGKRCGRIDLQTNHGQHLLRWLLSEADIVVHGYRGDALERLGLGDDIRRDLAPGLIDVSLDAYGWTGPWRHRRGFDSLVQMSCGIAHTGGVVIGGHSPDDDRYRPVPLPAQALDHAAGYLLATAALHGWARRLDDESGLLAKVSLARVAKVLLDGPRTDPATQLPEATDADWEVATEQTSWGPAKRLVPPVAIDGVVFRWDRPATALGSATDLDWVG